MLWSAVKKWTLGKFNEVTNVYSIWPPSCVPTYPRWLCLSLPPSFLSQTHRHACCGTNGDTRVNSIIVAKQREVLLTQFFGEAVTRPPRGPVASQSGSKGLTRSQALPGREQMALCCLLPLGLPPPHYHPHLQPLHLPKQPAAHKKPLRNLSFYVSNKITVCNSNN